MNMRPSLLWPRNTAWLPRLLHATSNVVMWKSPPSKCCRNQSRRWTKLDHWNWGFDEAEIVDLDKPEVVDLTKPEADVTKRRRVGIADKLVSFAVFPPMGRRLVPVRDLRKVRPGGNKVMHCPIISIYWNGGCDYMAAVRGQDGLDVDVFSVFVHSSKNSLTGILEPLKEWLERHTELGDAVWQLVQAMYSRKTSGTNFRDLWEREFEMLLSWSLSVEEQNRACVAQASSMS